jgi:hypothetical protein
MQLLVTKRTERDQVFLRIVPEVMPHSASGEGREQAPSFTYTTRLKKKTSYPSKNTAGREKCNYRTKTAEGNAGHVGLGGGKKFTTSGKFIRTRNNRRADISSS